MNARNNSGFWYLATPYSKWPEGTDNAFVEAGRVAGILIRAGVSVFCPIVHTHPIAAFGNIDRFDHAIWIPADEPLMCAARGLIVCKMPGWEDSKGISMEESFFAGMGKPTVYLEYPVESVPLGLLL
jgi:hypothetical protein